MLRVASDSPALEKRVSEALETFGRRPVSGSGALSRLANDVIVRQAT
jgi:hypothetical protein